MHCSERATYATVSQMSDSVHTVYGYTTGADLHIFHRITSEITSDNQSTVAMKSNSVANRLHHPTYLNTQNSII